MPQYLLLCIVSSACSGGLLSGAVRGQRGRELCDLSRAAANRSRAETSHRGRRDVFAVVMLFAGGVSTGMLLCLCFRMLSLALSKQRNGSAQSSGLTSFFRVDLAFPQKILWI